MAVSQYDKERLTESQQAEIQKVTELAQAGSMDWSMAHSIAEGIRSQAAGGGYSGGQDGSGYNPISSGSGGSGGGNYKSGSIGGVSWDADTDYSAVLGNAMKNNNTDVDWLQNLLNSRTAKATYNPGLNQYANDEFARNAQAYIDALVQAQAPKWENSGWDDTTNNIANQLIGMNYADWTQGEQYQALADRYGIQGKMSMQDVLGQISSRTGGLASSYATTAAQQQYNEYMSQLEEIARQMYSGDRSDLLENAQLSQSLADRDYNRYLDSLEQYYNERDYQHQLSRDEVADNRYDQQYADSVAATNKAEAQDRINAYLAAYGSVAELDPALIATSGYTASELAALEQYYANQQAQEAAAAAKKNAGSGGGTGGGGNTTRKPTLTAAQTLKALESGVVNDTTKAAYEYYYGQPWEDEGAGPESEPGADATISNRHGDSWIYIPGRGRFSYQEVENYVNSGQVIETYDAATNTYSYKWNKNYK